jgi:hypothetical protein
MGNGSALRVSELGVYMTSPKKRTEKEARPTHSLTDDERKRGPGNPNTLESRAKGQREKADKGQVRGRRRSIGWGGHW